MDMTDHIKSLILHIDPCTVLEVGPGDGALGRFILENVPETMLECVEAPTAGEETAWVRRSILEGIYDRVIFHDPRELIFMPYDLVIINQADRMHPDDAFGLWAQALSAEHIIMSVGPMGRDWRFSGTGVTSEELDDGVVVHRDAQALETAVGQ